MIFDERDHARLATLFDGTIEDEGGFYAGTAQRVPYPGYRPEVREAPNGDTKVCAACNGTRRQGTEDQHLALTTWRACDACAGLGRVPNVDTGKRFLHVALKYEPPAWAEAYLARAHFHACKVAEALRVPAAYYPHAENGTLRVLEYPPGAGSVEHTDFNLFSVVLWRSHPDGLEVRSPHRLEGFGGGPSDIPYCSQCGNVLPPRADDGCRGNPDLRDALEIDPHLHIGDLGAMVGLGPASPHCVRARPYAQQSIVYFASPAMAAPLPKPYSFDAQGDRTSVTVATCGDWQLERVARSRYT